MMRDLQNSLNFNFSRFNSNGNWQNLSFDDASQDILLSRNISAHMPLQCHPLLTQPPRPIANIYNCLESEGEERGDIKEVEYVQGEPEAKRVNNKQYFRMMKRRIKKVIEQFANGQPENEDSTSKKRGYLYQSRHRHACERKRGTDGKFLATRPEHERFREKKKRGRKPKQVTQEMKQAQLKSKSKAIAAKGKSRPKSVKALKEETK